MTAYFKQFLLKTNSLFKSPLKTIISEKAQASVEYILFIAVLFAASYGMIKLFILLWKIRFAALGYARELLNVFI